MSQIGCHSISDALAFERDYGNGGVGRAGHQVIGSDLAAICLEEFLASTVEPGDDAKDARDKARVANGLWRVLCPPVCPVLLLMTFSLGGGDRDCARCENQAT